MTDRGWLSEIFLSIEGEGLMVGSPTLFIRMSGCELRCPPCDTKYAWDKKDEFTIYNLNSETQSENPITSDELANLIKSISNDIKRIVITGGEPTGQIDYLLKLLPLLQDRFIICLETSGANCDSLIEVSPYLKELSLDIKLPSVWEVNINYRENLDILKELIESDIKIWLKCVIKEDTPVDELSEMAREISRIKDDISLYIQPLSYDDVNIEKVWTEELIFERLKYILNYLPGARFLPQVHKLLNWK